VDQDLTPDSVSQVKDAASLDDDRVVEELVALAQLREVGDPLTEQHGYEADAHLIYQTEVKCLLDDCRARDNDVLVVGDLSGPGDRGVNSIDERRCGPPRAASSGAR
jgi:hypothetical protein